MPSALLLNGSSERIFSQALRLGLGRPGIERPKLRNQRSIANINTLIINTLIYVLINLRSLQRIISNGCVQNELEE